MATPSSAAQTRQSRRKRGSPGENLHIRMTYNQGQLEMMAPSKRHEHFGYFLGRLIDVWTEERNIDVQSCRTMTFKREDLQRGLEPDNCYYIAHESAIRNKDELDFTVDPPPDLAIEIDLGGSAMDKLEIYAAFRVPEVWRWDGKKLMVNVLTTRGTYRKSDRSKAFPFLPVAEFAGFLAPTKLSEMKLLRSFRVWVRKQKKQNWKSGR
jgi:Uma2 family endonuclease